MKGWGPSNNCASGPLKASSGTGGHGPFDHAYEREGI